MATWSDMSAGARTATVAVIAIFFSGGGYEVWREMRPPVASDVTEPTGAKSATLPAAAPAPQTVAPPATDVVAAEAALPAPATIAPTTDTSEKTNTVTLTTDGAASAPAAIDPAIDEAAAAVAPADDPTAKIVAPVVSATAPKPEAPSFDLVRIDPDGSTVIAGQVAPGASVTLMIDGAEVATVLPDGNGKFVAMFTLPAATVGRLLTIVAKMPDGTKMPGSASVALAATAPVEAVAVAAVDGAANATDIATPAEIAPPADIASGGTTALAVTDQGVKVLQTGTDVPAEIGANVVLQTIAYPSAADVQFGGHGATGGFVRLYLDNSPLGDAVGVASDGSWSVTLSGIEPGLYTLRVDQLDAVGKVTSRFETPFKRESPAALAGTNAVAVPAIASVDVGAKTTAVVAADAPPVVPTAGTTATAAALAPGTDAAHQTPDTSSETSTDVASPETAAAAATATADASTAVVTTTTTADAATLTTPTVDAGNKVAPTTSAAEPVTTTATATAGIGTDTGDAAPSVDATATIAKMTTTALSLPPITITVQPGYTLWGIAKEQMGSGVMYVQVFDANRSKIKNPDLIYPGQVFTMPAAN